MLGHVALWCTSFCSNSPAILIKKLPQAVRQTVRIVAMDHPQGILRTGDRATVQFEFISHPEFVKEGMKLLFREGKTKVRTPVIVANLSLTLERRVLVL